jgi:N-acetylglutamate synthase
LRGPVSREQLARIEAAAVRSWPALETADLGGWLWRYASGGSQRANSVATLAFGGADIEAAVREAGRRYRARGAPCRFTIAEVSQPADIDARLAAMGYERGHDHVTMVKEIAARATASPPPCGEGQGGGSRRRTSEAGFPPPLTLPRKGEGNPVGASGIVLSPDPTPEWLAVYLAGLTPDRRGVAPAILAGLPARRAFFSCLRAGAVVGSGLSVADGRLASVQCMATLESARRQGCARAVLAAIEAWAAAQGCAHLYLQAEAANTAAVTLYAGFGFRIAGRYHLRTRR